MRVAILTSCIFVENIMSISPRPLVTVATALLLCLGVSACSFRAQEAGRLVLTAAPVATGWHMPPPQAPFDETPITPFESVGAPNTN